MKKIILLVLCTVFFSVSYGQNSPSAYLSVVVQKGELNQLSMHVFDEQGHEFSQKVEISDNYSLVEFSEMDTDADVYFYIGSNCGGAHLAVGDTLYMDVAAVDSTSGNFTYSFRGATAEQSYLFDEIVKTYFDFYYYLFLNEETYRTKEESLTLLSQNDSLFRSTHFAHIDDYYKHLVDSWYLRQYFTIMEHHDPAAAPAVIADIDPNDPVSVMSGLTVCWARTRGKCAPHSMEYYMEIMDVAQAKITSRIAMESIVRYCGRGVWEMPQGFSEQELDRFWKKYEVFAKDFPEIVKADSIKYNALLATAKGNPAPDIMLTAPDGTQTQLSSFFGKFVYIDVWATWCGPCCQEIPHLEKLVEHFKDRDDIVFLSISTDKNVAAWQAKLAKDKPTWPQYILDEAQKKMFSQQWNIAYIPRFLMIDKNGKIYESDAPRPSDENIIEVIEKALKK